MLVNTYYSLIFVRKADVDMGGLSRSEEELQAVVCNLQLDLSPGGPGGPPPCGL